MEAIQRILTDVWLKSLLHQLGFLLLEGFGDIQGILETEGVEMQNVTVETHVSVDM